MECGPNNCPVVAWTSASPSERKAMRATEAERLYRLSFTMEQIAAVLGVTHSCIVKDLKEFVPLEQTQPRTSKRGRKGEGRPKGNKLKPERRKNASASAESAAQLILDQGKSYSEIEKQTGFSSTVLRSAVARLEGRREAIIDPATLSQTAQEKLASAIRQHKRMLDMEFEQRVLEECRKRLDELSLPEHHRRLADAEAVLKSRYRGILTRAEFFKLISCLHTDRARGATDAQLNEAAAILNRVKVVLLGENDMPTAPLHFPRTWAEAEAMKQKVREARKAQRAQL